MIESPARYAPERAGTQPPNDYPPYTSTLKRAPKRPPIALAHTLSELTGPSCEEGWCGPDAVDLTHANGGEAQGQRLIVTGRIVDEGGAPLRRTLIEIWQANAAGRYDHDRDVHDAPLDPHFHGAGQALTDDQGRYRFLTIRPGAYPWRNTFNAWRPAHIHFSLFGPSFTTRLVTQMYFPGDPLLETDPVFHSIPDAAARERLIAAYLPATSEAEYALAYGFDIVLRGRHATPLERD